MADDLLSDIIGLENNIQQQLKREQESADSWLARVTGEQDLRLSRFRQEQEQTDRETAEKIKQQAQAEAGEIERQGAVYCRKLEALRENELLEALNRHIGKILPGWRDDHQDVQN
ncbi:MAG: hypothetical protein RQ754_04245 [Desulfuromonadales bacterium]|nr:hypothetical protein [Desulfuromonadales bacterium]